MVRKICYLIVVFFLAGGLEGSLGAETIKNVPEQGKIAEDEGKWSKEEALSLYREHFVLWQACHAELAVKLGENVKHDRAYIQRTIAALEKLSEILTEEKRQDLQTYITKYRQVAGSLERGLRKRLQKKRTRQTLHDLEREIKKKFSYKVVEIRTDLSKRAEDIVRSGKVPRLASSPPTQGKRYRYVADRNSKTFHKVMCIYVSKIDEEDRVYFETKKEARKSGRRMHRHCR